MKVLGISGPSCCGKSTLARHLRSVLPNAAILYEDDFYLPESKLPVDDEGQSNWDCPEAFDLQSMRQRILEFRKNDKLPDQNTREENNNNDGPTLLNDQHASEVKRKLYTLNEPVLIVEGILLFHKQSPLIDLFDTKIMCPFDYNLLKSRREQRVGYDTPDGAFWKDPPNYFEDQVWPEFERHCSFLFNVHGSQYTELSSEASEQLGLIMPPTLDMRGMIEFVIDRL